MNTMAESVVDLTEGLARAGDDREFFKELLEMFLEDAASKLEEIRKSVASGDAQTLASAAHSVKGAAANLAAHPVREVALRLETAGREGRANGLEGDVEALEERLRALETFTGQFEV